MRGDRERAFWRSPALGRARDLELPQGTLRVFEAGSGPPLVMPVGFFVNANLWRKVVPLLETRFRCVVLDLPFGSHQLPMPRADLSLPGFADLVAGAMDALELEDVTLVGNDTGTAIAQALAARRPERVGRLVLTSGDAFENFPPKLFRYLKPVAKLPAPAMTLLFGPLRLRPLRRLPIAYGWLSKRPFDRDASDSYVLPPLIDRAVRADARRANASVDSRHTLAAAARLGEFDRPVLVAWAREDRAFAPRYAERLRSAFPDARLEWIEDSYTYSPEDRPERLAELIAEFAAPGSGSSTTTGSSRSVNPP